MTVQLTDAEYSRLTPIEKAQYWHDRYQTLKADYDKLRDDHGDMLWYAQHAWASLGKFVNGEITVRRPR